MSLATTQQAPAKANGNGGGKAMDTIKGLFDKAKPSVQAVIPRHIDPDRLIKVALVAISRTPRLMECTPQSLLQSFMIASQLGLDVGGTLGSAYLVPYKHKSGRYEAQFIVGYRGLIDLARRSGQIESIEARVVYEGDDFELEYGLEPKLTHRPKFQTEKMIGAYAIARLKGGERVIEYMSKTAVDGIRERSRAANNGPWVTDYTEMARKTVVRRISKYLPLTTEMATAIEASDHSEYAGGNMPDISLVPQDALPEPESDEHSDAEQVEQEQSTRVGALKEKLKGRDEGDEMFESPRPVNLGVGPD